MRSVRRPLVLVLLLGALGAIAVAALVLRTSGDEPAGAPVAVELESCRNLLPEASRECWTRAFLAAVEGRDDPRPAVAAVADAARSEGSFLLSSCHGLMHTVGRTYARETGVTLANLMNYLPRSNDPGCSAGFAHGLVTGVGPQIDPRRPGDAAAVCSGAGTRYQRYSCVHGLGHAFMRIHGDRLAPALSLCRSLGPRVAADCAQGAYHDYWFAVVGADEASLPPGATTDPRELCGAQPTALVRPCWYRAFVDNRPEGIVVDSPEHLDVLCEGLDGLQREACVTGAAVIGPADPAIQLELCAGLDDPADAAGCIRGTKTQNLLGRPVSDFVRLIGRCELFAGATRAGCYRWLGKAIAVLTDGAFEQTGCPKLAEADARGNCRAGARTMEDALVTFS
jgi:hypothetical protein